MAKAGIAVLVIAAALVYGVTQIDATPPAPEADPEVTTTYEVEPGKEWLVVAVDTVADIVTCADATMPRGTAPGKDVPVGHDVAEHLAAELNGYTLGQFSEPPLCPVDQG